MGFFKNKRCAKCGADQRDAINGLSRHHVYPRRWNRRQNTAFPKGIRGEIAILCRTPCHDELNQIILSHEAGGVERLPAERYVEILQEFIAL